MFEKLLSNLPYNPGLTQQFSFYAKRLRHEESIRRLGLMFIVLAFFVQFFAVLNPPQATVADSTNDLINGGFSNKSQAVADCQSNLKQYGTILSNYGISCDAVAAGTTVTGRSIDYGNQLFSMGWNPLGATNPTTHKATEETPANLLGLSRPVYWRLLSNWDTGPYSTYQMLQVTSSTGQTYFIMYACGNLVHVGVPPSIPPCAYNGALLSNSSQCVKPQQPTGSIPAPNCNVPGKTTLPVNSPQCFQPCQYNSSIASSSAQCFQPCQYNSAIPAESSQCKPCQSASGSSDTLACVAVSKTAADPTQGWSIANGKTAQPGDTIVYTLYAKNNGLGTVPNFLMQENLSDVLDYATVQNLDGGSLNNSTGEVVWPTADIQAGATLSHTITVQVMNPIPSTPPSISDPGHYDSVMTNVYGNSININVPQPLVKTIATTSASLPNTGPGSSLIIAGAIAVLAGYFFFRTRLLADESVIAVQETTSGGF